MLMGVISTLSYYVRMLSWYADSFGLGKAARRAVYKILLDALGSLSKRSSVVINGLELALIPGDKGISRELRVFGIHEPLATSVLVNILAEGMNIIDIGSNIGYYCLLEASIVGPGGRVVAVEPNLLAFQYLEKNTRSLSNVILRNLAVWDEDGSVDFVVMPQSNLSHIKGVKQGVSSGSLVRVPARSLDSLFAELCEQHSFCNVDLVRMDVEGGEVKIIRGARKTIESFLPRIFMELHIPTIGRDRARALLKDLKDLGYYIEYMVPRGLDLPMVADPDDVLCNVDMAELISNPPMLDLELFLASK